MQNAWKAAAKGAVLHCIQDMSRSLRSRLGGNKMHQHTKVILKFEGKSTQDYIYCEDCKEFVDFWKYGRIEDTCHDECNWRFVTYEELKGCVESCKEEGCMDERFL